MRLEILEIYKVALREIDRPIVSLGLVGGHIKEPELAVTDYEQVTFYGIQDNEGVHTQDFDLNQFQTISERHDLVLCSQVLEHVYDVKQAIENLAKLVRKGGYLWIACPASNYAHGSPEYFSAGYTPELITNLLAPLDFEIILAEKYRSKRMHFYTQHPPAMAYATRI